MAAKDGAEDEQIEGVYPEPQEEEEAEVEPHRQESRDQASEDEPQSPGGELRLGHVHQEEGRQGEEVEVGAEDPFIPRPQDAPLPGEEARADQQEDGQDGPQGDISHGAPSSHSPKAFLLCSMWSNIPSTAATGSVSRASLPPVRSRHPSARSFTRLGAPVTGGTGFT